MRVGIGYDAHRFCAGRELVLGGVRIPHEKGLEGHSDADVLLHAIADALLGAAACGDIGLHFPDSDEQYRGIDSLELLRRVGEVISTRGYSVGNIDVTVIAQGPPISPHTGAMRAGISAALDCGENRVQVKATTTEGMGFTGRGEGIAAMAVALLEER